MKLITHPLDDGSGASAAVCVCTYDERSVPASAGFIWNQIVPKAWATTSAKVAARLWMHADETTIQRLLRAGVVSLDQRDQRLRELATAAPASKRDRAEELAVRLATRPALIDAIHFLLNYLAARCDGAVKEDGQGFNGTDTGFGHELAARPSLSPKQAAYAQIMLWKYMGQLGHLPQFDLVYGAEAEAERERMRRVEEEKQQARMAGKLCKAHGRQITFLGKGKRVGFCNECKPADATDEKAITQALEDEGLPTIEAAEWVPAGKAVVVPNGPGAQASVVVVLDITDPRVTPEMLDAQQQPVAVNCAGCQQPLAEDDQHLLCPACRSCGLCGNPIIDTRATCNHASAMNADQRASEKANGRAVCMGCDQYIISGLHRCMGKPKAVPAHPVDAAVALLREAGLGDLIDPEKVEVIRQHVDAPVPDPPVASYLGSTADGHQFTLDARQSAPEASAAIQTQPKPASGPVRAAAGLTVALQPGTDSQWEEIEARTQLLAVLREEGATDEVISFTLDQSLAAAARLAKAEAKAGNIITAARR